MNYKTTACALLLSCRLSRHKNYVFPLCRKCLSTSPVLSADDRKHPRAVQLSYSVYESTKPVSESVGPPVVILHGLYGSKSNWHSLAKGILAQTGRKVITADLRNHGESPHSSEFSFDVMKDDLLSLLDELRIPKAALVGHSLGGRTVMAAALTQPDYVDQLVVVDISPLTISPNSSTLPQFAKAMKNIQLPSGIPLSKARKVVNQALAPVVKSKGIQDFLVTNVEEGPDKTFFRWRVNLDAIEASMDSIFNFPAYNTSYSGPTLFIGGGDSDYIRRDEHDVIKQKFFPKAEFHYIPGSGHWVHSEKPKEFLEVLCTFLNAPTR